jgi:hypothetical protein
MFRYALGNPSVLQFLLLRRQSIGHEVGFVRYLMDLVKCGTRSLRSSYNGAYSLSGWVEADK